MNLRVIILGLSLLALSGWSQTLTGSYTNSTVTAIPDGSPVGVMEQFTVSGLGITVSNVLVTLDITGGFNGDLYAYLVSPQGQLAVLLNRPGVTGSNPFGYGDAGMNLTLDGLAANNIHDYGSTPGYSLSGTTWAADGRNVNPQAAGSVLYGTPPTADLSIFQNANANGVWTFFIADLGAGGGTASLNNVILSILTVPEPQTAVMLIGGLAMLGLLSRRKKRLY
jgi:subtilisin-like proprotein convertase family protein